MEMIRKARRFEMVDEMGIVRELTVTVEHEPGILVEVAVPRYIADATVKSICVQNWDTNGDGELSFSEAAAVTSLGTVFGFNESDPRCIEFKARLRATIEDLIGKGYAHFISGGAMGMDMFAAEAVLELREEYPWIMLEMVSPFDGQADRWEPEYQARHARLFDEADMVTAISHQYTRACL